MTKLKFAVILVNSKNYDIDASTNFRVFGWVIETFQPAQITDMNHTTNSRCQFNEHTVWSNVFHQATVTASFWEFIFDCAPWIFTHLFNGKTHFATFLVQCYNLSFVLVS